MVEPTLNRLTKNGKRYRTEPRVMQVLARLAQNPGTVVTRQELLDEIWQDLTVGDDALTRAVSELRKILGDDPKSPRYIETIYKTGYRLIASATARPPNCVEPMQSAWFGSFRLSLGEKAPHIFALCAAVVVSIGSAALLWRSASGEVAYARAFPVTALAGEEIYPSLSPDGGVLAFSWRADGEENFDIYLKRVGTATPERLTRSAPAHAVSAAWSPDGGQIAYAHVGDGACQLRLIDIASGVSNILSQCGKDSLPRVAWSPDGSQIAYSNRDSRTDPYKLHLISLGSRETRILTAPPAHNFGDTLSAFSPDGGEIAFVRTKIFGISDVYKTSLEDGKANRLTHDNLKVHGLAWEKDERWIYFSSNRLGGDRIWRIAPDGRNIRMVPAASDAFMITHAANEGRLAFEKRYSDRNIWRVDSPFDETDKTDPYSIASSTRWEAYPALSSDGTRIAFASDRSGTPEIWIAGANGENPRQITDVGGAFVSTPRWSPDGAHIVFASRTQGNADIYIVEADTSKLQRLTESPFVDTAPNWSANGETVFFASNRLGDWQVWNAAINGDAPRQVTFSGGYAARQSADESALYFSKVGQRGIWTVNEKGEESIFIETETPVADSDWMLKEDDLYILSSNALREASLIRVNTQSRKEDRYAIPARIAQSEFDYAGFSIADDQSAILFGQVDSRSSDIVLLEGLN